MEAGDGRVLSSPVSVTRSMDIRPCLVNLRVYGESSRIDGLIAYHDLAIFIDQNEIAHADLGEVSRQWVQPCERYMSAL